MVEQAQELLGAGPRRQRERLGGRGREPIVAAPTSAAQQAPKRARELGGRVEVGEVRGARQLDQARAADRLGDRGQQRGRRDRIERAADQQHRQIEITQQRPMIGGQHLAPAGLVHGRLLGALDRDPSLDERPIGGRREQVGQAHARELGHAHRGHLLGEPGQATRGLGLKRPGVGQRQRADLGAVASRELERDHATHREPDHVRAGVATRLDRRRDVVRERGHRDLGRGPNEIERQRLVVAGQGLDLRPPEARVAADRRQEHDQITIAAHARASSVRATTSCVRTRIASGPPPSGPWCSARVDT